MKNRWLWIGIGGIVALVAIVLVVLSLQGEPIPAVQLAREDVVATLTVTGEVAADTAVDYSPKVSARIADITVDEGDMFDPGQLLVQLDAGDVRARLAEAQSRAEQARADLADVRQGTRPEEIRLWEARLRESQQQIERVQASLAAQRHQLAEAERNARRIQELYRQEFASAQEADTARTRADIARRELERLDAELAAARTQRAQTQAQLDEARHGPTQPEIESAEAAAEAARAAAAAAREQVDDFRVVSRMTGIVTERLQDPGDLAIPGQPVLRAINPATLEIIGSVEENDLGKIRAGDQAYVILDAAPETALEARVRRLGSRVNPENGTLEIRLNLLDSALSKLKGIRLLPGMTADVNVITDRLRDAMVLPASAVRNEGGAWMVYLFNGHRLVKQPVEAERISIEYFRVLSGLSPGDWVAASASDELLARTRVRPVPMEDAPKPATPPSGMMGR